MKGSNSIGLDLDRVWDRLDKEEYATGNSQAAREVAGAGGGASGGGRTGTALV